MTVRLSGLAVLAFVTLVSCGLFGNGVIYPEPQLSISNDTTIPVTLVVNGQTVATYSPGSGADPIAKSMLPALPWHVEARTTSGRLLTSIDVHQGDVWYTTPDPDGHSSSKGVAELLLLSCGRIELWSGSWGGGPAGGLSSYPPGDCNP